MAERLPSPMMRSPSPMARDRPVLGLGWPLADHDRGVDDPALPAIIGSAMRFAAGPTSPRRPGQFAAKFTASLHVEGLLDGLVHQVPLPALQLTSGASMRQQHQAHR